MASPSELQNIMFPVFVPKSNVYTRKHKYPRTTYSCDLVDWSHNPLQAGVNLMRFHPQQSFSPQAPKYSFRPLPPFERPVKDQQLELRKTLVGGSGRKGLSTPEPSIHLGYKLFSLNPTERKLRHFDDPIPEPLVTTKRASYVDPRSMPHLLWKQSTERYRFNENDFALGIVPCTLAIPPEPVKDTSNI